MTKILFVGDTTFRVYVKSFYEAANDLTNVEADIFDTNLLVGSASGFQKMCGRIERNLKNGLLINCMNDELINKCKSDNYDICFLYSCSYVYPKVIKQISDMGIYVAMYCNDNPFSDYYPKRMWNKFIRSLQYADIAYSYRSSNNSLFQKFGAKKVSLMQSYYISKYNYFIEDEKIQIEVPDVVFMGHFEDDGRDKYIDALLDEGIYVGLNESWRNYRSDDNRIVRLPGDEKLYNEIINKAKIAIVFLSTLNQDTYTRRCFEIPACKTMMVSVYTEDISSMYSDGKEIVFFRNPAELKNQTLYYLNHDDKRIEIARNGYARLLNSKNEVHDRIYQIITDYERSKYR